MENRAKAILKKHGCEFIQMTSESRVLWKNRNNVIREDDIAVLSNMEVLGKCTPLFFIQNNLQ